MAQSLNNLGVLLGTEGKFAEAEPLHTRALEIRRRHFGSRHMVVAQSLENLAAACQGLEKYEQAEKLLRESVAIWEENMGAEHPSTAQACYDLGALLFTAGKYEQAEEVLQRARRILVKVFDMNDRNLAAVYNALAVVYEKLGREQEARAYTARFMKAYQQKDGADA